MGKRITEVKRTRILEALQQPGAKLARVARRFGVSPSAVKVIRAHAGMAPLATPEQKRLAAEARDTLLVEARRRRAQLMLRLLEDAERLRQRIFEPATAYTFGGSGDNYGFVEHEIEEPDAKSKQALAIAMGIAIDKSLQLEKYDSESTTAARGAIIELVDRLKAMPEDGEPEPAPELAEQPA